MLPIYSTKFKKSKRGRRMGKEDRQGKNWFENFFSFYLKLKLTLVLVLNNNHLFKSSQFENRSLLKSKKKWWNKEPWWLHINLYHQKDWKISSGWCFIVFQNQQKKMFCLFWTKLKGLEKISSYNTFTKCLQIILRY